MAEHVAHLAVLALADGESQPQVRALHAVERGLDRLVTDAIDRHAGAQFVELRLRHRAVRAHAVTPQPAGRGQFEDAGERAVIGEQQQPFGIEIEPADADQAGQVPGANAGTRSAGLAGRRARSKARAACDRGTAACAGAPAALRRRRSMRSRAVTLSAGERITVPLTATRPATIHASASRREASPARAITLAMRSPPLSRLTVVVHDCPRQ